MRGVFLKKSQSSCGTSVEAHRMRTLPILLLSVLLAASMLAMPAVDAAAPACARMVLTAHDAYPPVAWAHNGTLEGAGIDVVRRLAAANRVQISVRNEGSWNAAQTAVKRGKADAIVGLYLTGPRRQFFNYVQPAIAPDPSAVVVRRDETFVYRGWNSLIGKRGAVSEGEQYGQKFDAFMDSKLTTQRVKGFEGVYNALLRGTADYGLVGYYSALTSAPNGIKIAEPNFVTEGLYIAFGKSSRCNSLLPAFSVGVKQMTADGTIKKLFARALRTYKQQH
jgi:polar amino acid transport system substrate-binding protein